MTCKKLLWCMTVLALSLFTAGSGNAQTSHKVQHGTKAAANTPAYQPGLEPRAIDILKATGARLAAARSMAFTAVVSYESPSRLGPPLVYSTKSQVLMQRPDKLNVITLADGPPSEFYYDGKTMTAFAIPENLMAVADAPPTIDAALEAAYDTGAIYFPFTDVIVADPYKDLSAGLKSAFYIGQSEVVGGVTTDMVAYVTGDVFVQVWIGTKDKLPRRVYAIYLNDPARLRHVLELSDWRLDVDIAATAFVATNSTGAARIAFARPDATDAPGMPPPPKSKLSKTK
ncbi:MAG: hypothetical protein QOJ04_4512 [Caballeronia sp.]|jgi:hypothetical protein|nr:hypothetical protein [Caballeronia sp.]